MTYEYSQQCIDIFHRYQSARTITAFVECLSRQNPGRSINQSSAHQLVHISPKYTNIIALIDFLSWGILIRSYFCFRATLINIGTSTEGRKVSNFTQLFQEICTIWFDCSSINLFALRLWFWLIFAEINCKIDSKDTCKSLYLFQNWEHF